MNLHSLIKRPDRRLALILTGLLALLFLAFGLTSGQAPTAVFLATVPFALLIGLYLLASDAPFVTALARWEDTRGAYQTLWLPGILWLLYLAYAGQVGRLSFGDALVGAVFLGLPTLLVANRRRLRGLASPLLCLAVLALPLGLWQVMGWHGGGGWPPEGGEIVLRVGAWLLGAALLFLPEWTRRERRDICLLGAVLFIWYSVEFDAIPSLSLPPQHGLIGYFHLAAIGLFLYLLTMAGRLDDLGFTFRLSAVDWREALVNFGLFAVIGVPFGLLTGFIAPSKALPPVTEVIGGAVGIAFFIALPEEILFRGTLHRYLERMLGWTPARTLVLSSVIFGAAHLNNPPKVGLYFILASVAGWFYGRAYLRTGKVTTAAVVHWLVDLVWSVLFAG